MAAPRPTSASASPAAGRSPRPTSCARSWTPRSQHRQVALELPRGGLHPVVVPLLALDLDEAVEHVLAERAQHELGLGGELDRLAQRLGELLDPQPLPLVGRQVVEVLLHRLGQLVALLDALEA